MATEFKVGMDIIKISRNPFKSGSHVTTVIGFCEHPYTKEPALLIKDGHTFIEERKCKEYIDG